MRKFGVVVSRYFTNNRLFNLNDKNANRDNCLYHMYLLKTKLLDKGIELTTYDQHPITEYDSLIFLDLDNSFKFKKEELINSNKKIFLIIQESELIRPDNWFKENHKYFKKIFTWHDEWVNGEKYIKYYWPNKIPEEVKFTVSGKEKLCVMIAGNKMVYHDARELYSERIKAIRWFEQNHSKDFDLYGMGWDKGILKRPYTIINKTNITNKIYKKLNKKILFKRIFKPFTKYFPSYMGKIASKKEVYAKYKFAICYENAKEIPGYITEKIFDCFFAGCVPIYWGAPNVTEYIPENTFIDKRNFKNYDKLYAYIKNMPDREYLNYLKAIKNYIESDKIYQFSAECFADTIIENIMKT